jgi:regulator of sigma E protease
MNETVLTWIVFILAFGGMVLIHEFGHFIVARLCAIEVEEFGIGLPTPGALTLFTWQGTRFTLNWLPLGGFVRPKGENDPSIPGGLAAASPWKRLSVLVAGPLMNLLTAMILYSFMVMRGGVPIPSQIRVTDVVPSSPAAQAGIQSGDILLSGQGQTITDYEDLRNVIGSHENSPVAFTVLRDGKQIEVPVTPRRSSEDDRVVIGVYFEQRYTSQPATFGESLQFGAQATGNAVRTLISLPAQLMRGTLPAEQGRIIGLKGIYDIMEQSVSNDLDASSAPPTTTTEPTTNPFDKMTTLMIIASLSVSLGVFNLFPFPALDGGRILFVLPELIFRRRVSPRIENLVHGLGMAVLLIFMLYVNVMDFVNPIRVTIP